MDLSDYTEPLGRRWHPVSDIGRPVDHSAQYEKAIQAMGEVTEVAPLSLSLERVKEPLEDIFTFRSIAFTKVRSAFSTLAGPAPVPIPQ